MEGTDRAARDKEKLPLILAASVVQGWALYLLHESIKSHHWPATHHGWLVALYAVTVFVPLTIQMTADYARRAALWWMMAVLGAAVFYFGWYWGGNVSDPTDKRLDVMGTVFAISFPLIILWLMALPFAQSYLSTGAWVIRYDSLFTFAWRNKLVLAEAALFTGLFWLLLTLWQTLFHMLRIDFFRELFGEPIFVYPVTSLTFGCALHLIGSVDRLTSVILEQVLNVLKWLALLTGCILAFFTLALVYNLAGLAFTGHRAINATWLLWLVAVMVLLLNAAYRDGTDSRPYPKWIALALRTVVPLTVVIAVTALYALIVRAREYGLTVERVWGFVVCGAALVYAVGYSVSAFDRSGWMRGMARVNVGCALALIAVISAALTPLLSPYRLAANSQFKIAQRPASDATNAWNSPFHYLRFDSGRYGRQRLQQLAGLQGAGNERIRSHAQDALSQQNSWVNNTSIDATELLATLQIYPAGRALDEKLVAEIAAELRKPENAFLFQRASEQGAVGIFIDLNGDDAQDFVLLGSLGGAAFENTAGGEWTLVGRFHVNSAKPGPWSALVSDLEAGNYAAQPQRWRDLNIGTRHFRFSPND
jgi:hypothetical protein